MKDIATRSAVLFILLISNCTSASPALKTVPVSTVPSPTQTLEEEIASTYTPTREVTPMTESFFADVITVRVTGAENAYQFKVEVSSPDTGCEQFADWWEVLSEDGQLLYRRVLLHSHVTEQPFTRSGGPVEIDANTVVIVRAHMNTDGYGGAAMKGSASGGFEPVELGSGFAAGVEALDPLPGDCAF